MKPITLYPGDVGLIVHPDGTISTLLPVGVKHLSHLHGALVGSAWLCVNDELYRAEAAETLRLLAADPGGRA